MQRKKPLFDAKSEYMSAITLPTVTPQTMSAPLFANAADKTIDSESAASDE